MSGSTTPIAMLEGSRTTWRVSFDTSARMRRSFATQALELDACGALHARGRSCRRRRRAVRAVDARATCSTTAMKASSMLGSRTARRSRPSARISRRRALREHPAGIHDRDPVAVFRLLHEVRGDDDGHALLGERGDAAPEGAARQRIGAAGRLIEKQDLRLVQQRRGHGEALLVAARQLRARSCARARRARIAPAPSRCALACARRAGRRRWRRTRGSRSRVSGP